MALKPISFSKGQNLAIVDALRSSYISELDPANPMQRNGKQFTPDPVIELLTAEEPFTVDVETTDTIKGSNGVVMYKIAGPRPTKVRKR